MGRQYVEGIEGTFTLQLTHRGKSGVVEIDFIYTEIIANQPKREQNYY